MVDQPASETFDIGLSEQDGVVVISVHGIVDLDTATRLSRTAYPAAADATAGIVFDLREVTLLASSGLTVLVRTVALLPKGATAALIAPNTAVRRPITSSGLDETITTVADMATALDAVRSSASA